LRGYLLDTNVLSEVLKKRLSRDLLSALVSRSRPIGLEDVLIGATALVHGLVVATRNVRHFERIEGLFVESWWES
jgi:tRNA(fMet)-specific endonuclease VapC